MAADYKAGIKLVFTELDASRMHMGCIYWMSRVDVDYDPSFKPTQTRDTKGSLCVLRPSIEIHYNNSPIKVNRRVAKLLISCSHEISGNRTNAYSGRN